VGRNLDELPKHSRAKRKEKNEKNSSQVADKVVEIN